MLEKREADVIIIGGGIMGCATAYRLAKQGVDVLVLEKKEIGNGGSCRNAGGVRQSARDPKELPLAMYAVANIWPHLSEELGVDVEYHQGGNLRLGLTEKDIKVLENHTAKSLKLGLDVKMISGDEAREICPYMSKEVVAASWCPTDGHDPSPSLPEVSASIEVLSGMDEVPADGLTGWVVFLLSRLRHPVIIATAKRNIRPSMLILSFFIFHSPFFFCP